LAPPIIVGIPQATPPTGFRKKRFLFDQIGERLWLPAVEPAADGDQQQVKYRHGDRERKLSSHG